MNPVRDWHALRAARAQDVAARLPFAVNGKVVGSVAHAHLAALRAWPRWLQVNAQAVALQGDAATLHEALLQINAALREQGLILAWRDEPFPLFDPATLQRLAVMERAATRFWGTLTLGAHATGYVADDRGRPTHLWIAQRAATKATDPGKHDNLIGGGVPEGQTPLQALLREGWEEAGLAPAQMRELAPGSVLGLRRDIPEGLQHEWLYSYDLRLPTGLEPSNQDGEVAGFACLPLQQALQLAWGEAMTVDAALVTLDFASRHRLWPQETLTELDMQLQPLRVAAGVQ